jgi:hypothetical protein
LPFKQLVELLERAPLDLGSEEEVEKPDDPASGGIDECCGVSARALNRPVYSPVFDSPTFGEFNITGVAYIHAI